MKKEEYMKIKSLSLHDYDDIVGIGLLFYDYFIERHGDILVGTKEDTIKAIEELLNYNNFIYYVIDDSNNDILGFVTISTNNQFNMIPSHMVVDYMYVVPSARNSKVTALLFGTIGHVADTLEMDVLGTTMIGSSNINNAKVVKGEEYGKMYHYKRDSFKDIYKKYIRRYIE